MAKHHMAHDKFSQLAGKLVKAAPPCMSSADDWEPTAAALEELSLTLEHGNPAAITPLPDAAGRQRHKTAFCPSCQPRSNASLANSYEASARLIYDQNHLLFKLFNGRGAHFRLTLSCAVFRGLICEALPPRRCRGLHVYQSLVFL